MKLLLFTLIAICLEFCLFPQFGLAGIPTDDELKAMVTVTHDNVVPAKALEIAKQTENTPVLLAAVNSDNPNTRIKAIQIIASLSPDKAKPALIAVLENQRVWSYYVIMGSEAMTAQDILIQTVRSAVSKEFKMDASGYNLFDGVQRERLVKEMKAK